jgi:hypothetical protein
LSIALDLLKKARDCGATFNFIDNQVKIRAPKPLAEDLLAELRKHKPEVIEVLRQECSALRKEAECWLLEEWRRMSIPEWRQILQDSIDAKDKYREDYARWMLREMLNDSEYKEGI